MVKPLYLTIGFVIIIQLSAMIIERGRQWYAQGIGYSGEYSISRARMSFSNPDMQSAFKGVITKYEALGQDYKNTSEWQDLILKDRKDRAQIEMSGKLIMLLISFAGLATYFIRRKKDPVPTWIDWVAIIFGLVFMRDVLIHAFDLARGGMLCHEAALWQQFHLPVIKSAAASAILGILLFLYILFKIPGENMLPFMISGFVGTLIGGLLWIFLLGDLLL